MTPSIDFPVEGNINPQKSMSGLVTNTGLIGF